MSINIAASLEGQLHAGRDAGLRAGRRAVRRGVLMPCELIHGRSDEPAQHLATDLSTHGLWLHVPRDGGWRELRRGEHVVVSFLPKGWESPLTLFATVARLLSGAGAPGVGVSFLDLGEGDARRLRLWLNHHTRPPLVRYRVPSPSVRFEFDERHGKVGAKQIDAPQSTVLPAPSSPPQLPQLSQRVQAFRPAGVWR